jgi:predicted NAD/FAD-binding protein
MLRIAVVGGGIAGVGAAWSLSRAGHRVDLFEARETPGGNARTYAWPYEGRQLTAGLAVLAWPQKYFRTYEHLLRALDVATLPVRLRFFVHKDGATFGHEQAGALYERHRHDFERWQLLVSRVRGINRRFDDGPPSLYRTSFKNPLTYLPAWQMARASGISRAFWDEIVVAIYSSAFLTARLDSLPAFILPTIDDLVSIFDGGRMQTWRDHSGVVFDRMLAALTGDLHLGCAVTRILPLEGGVSLTDQHGEERGYDRVVLAADAARMADALPRGRARSILSGVTYVEATDTSFSEGVAHGDERVLPLAHRDTILRDYCTAIDLVDREYRNHFVVSSWAPVARGTNAKMIVSYNQPRHVRLAGPTFSFSNRGAHPDLSLGNLWRARRLRALQGAHHLYYCGAYTTPGNGHDLSLLSGLVVASALGAPYPFANDPEANADFDLLRRQMLRA